MTDNIDPTFTKFLNSIGDVASSNKVDCIKVDAYMPSNIWIIDEIRRIIYISNFMYLKMHLSMFNAFNPGNIKEYPILGSIYGLPIIEGKYDRQY